MPRDIYLDHNATTSVDARVVEAMVDALARTYGNPSSLHRAGERAAEAMERARAAVAALVGARPGEIVFTSGGTESINTAVGAALAQATENGRPRILTSTVEHPAVLQPLTEYAQRGFVIEELAVDEEGRVAIEEGVQSLRRNATSYALVTLQLANNETGVVTPFEQIAAIGAAARQAGALFHLDAVQVPGKLAFALGTLPVDLVSISAHKFHGPKGVGALYVREGTLPSFSALVRGGPQERERRGGTPNVPGIVGMGKAAELARDDVLNHGPERVAARRDHLERELLERIPGSRINGARAPRLPNTSSLHLPGVPEDLLVQALAAEGVAVSSGAACSSSRHAPSPVLLAMGRTREEARSTVRISLGRETSSEEVEAAVRVVAETWRELSGLTVARATS